MLVWLLFFGIVERGGSFGFVCIENLSIHVTIFLEIVINTTGKEKRSLAVFVCLVLVHLDHLALGMRK